jgi:thiol-disulfide isomerase/thioredoxin
MLVNFFAAALLLGPGPVAEGPFQDLTLDQALAAAKRDGKVVMIDFFTTWCVPCKKLDKVTWTDPEVLKWLGEKTVALKMDAEKEVEAAKRFNVSAYPTIVFIKADGSKIDQIVGFKEPKEFLSVAGDALAGRNEVTRATEKLVGHENDPMEREQHADALVQAGKYEEALAEYLWCFDHGNDDESNGYHGVRLSFLLSDIVRLGERYPLAIKALEERRDRAEGLLLSGQGNRSQVADVSALNGHLKTPKRTLELFDRMREQKRLDSKLQHAFLRDVAEYLVEAKRYRDLLDASGDPEKELEIRISSTESAIKVIEEMKREGTDAAGDSRRMRAHLVSEFACTYEALLGTKQGEKAGIVADRLIAFAPFGPTYIDLVQRALHADEPEVARALADRGRKTLPENEKHPLERAAKKIPPAK